MINTFVIENELVSRKIYFEKSVPKKSVFTNKKTNYTFENDGTEAIIALPGIELENSKVEFKDRCINFYGDEFILKWEFKLFDKLPVIESRIGIKSKPRDDIEDVIIQGDGINGNLAQNCILDYCDGLGCLSNHVDLQLVEFFDRTDYTNYLVKQNTIPLYNKYAMNEFNGHIFALIDRISNNVCVIVKNAPCCTAHLNKLLPDFLSKPISNIHICSTGIDMSQVNSESYTYSYPVAVGVCQRDNWCGLIRKYYRAEYNEKSTYVMSNTWGDGNGDSRICEEFILSEIESASRLGVDVVQIDDGWQQGITANSKISTGGTWGIYRKIDPNFWKINSNKFPNGFSKIVSVAKQNEIKLGLWFSPDKYKDYCQWRLDAHVMIDFYHKYGIKYFKLDGIDIENKASEQNVVKMLEEVDKLTDGNVVFNMDITSGKRFGYFPYKKFGNLFVENRYTGVGNYYPYCSLRNLWNLVKFLPAQKLQFEVLNNQRNIEIYSNDILAPSTYDIDYIFASIMVSNPLLWMELSALSDKNADKLSKIIKVYKNYRDDFDEITPIGNEPDGFSLTGFYIKGFKNNYVILLRELTSKSEFNIRMKKVLMTNDENICISPVRLTRKQTYVFGIV